MYSPEQNPNNNIESADNNLTEKIKHWAGHFVAYPRDMQMEFSKYGGKFTNHTHSVSVLDGVVQYLIENEDFEQSLKTLVAKNKPGAKELFEALQKWKAFRPKYKQILELLGVDKIDDNGESVCTTEYISKDTLSGVVLDLLQEIEGRVHTLHKNSRTNQ